MFKFLIKFRLKAEDLRKNLLTKYLTEEETTSSTENKRVNSTSNTSNLNLSLKSNSSSSSHSSTSSTGSKIIINCGTVNTHLSLNLSATETVANPFNLKDLEEQDERDVRRLEIQYELNNQGASDLVIDLFMSDISNKVFKESVLLAIALLEGGNTQVQKTMYNRLIGDKNSEKFCKAFHDRIEVAQKEIKNLNSFMSSDMNDVQKIKAAVVNLQQQQQTQNAKDPHGEYTLNSQYNSAFNDNLTIGFEDSTTNGLLNKQRSTFKTNKLFAGDETASNTLMTAFQSTNNVTNTSSNMSNSSCTTTNSQNNLHEDIAIMEIILRFLQLLCENHNCDLQNYLRVQSNNKTSYNLVCETLQFLDCICGSTTGGLGN